MRLIPPQPPLYQIDATFERFGDLNKFGDDRSGPLNLLNSGDNIAYRPVGHCSRDPSKQPTDSRLQSLPIGSEIGQLLGNDTAFPRHARP
jgi:hypothetical protein